jgi:hypothetical protein
MVRTASAPLLFMLILTATNSGSQNPTTPQPYNVAEAYQIYNLLLPREPSYAFGKDRVMIREEADQGGGTPCLTTAAAKKFADAVAAFNRLQQKKWTLQPKFQLDKPYKLITPEDIKALPDTPTQSAANSFVEMSTVGFNREKTLAVLFMGSPCGGLCGGWSYHLLEKVNGKWHEVPGVNCAIAS